MKVPAEGFEPTSTTGTPVLQTGATNRISLTGMVGSIAILHEWRNTTQENEARYRAVTLSTNRYFRRDHLLMLGCF